MIIVCIISIVSFANGAKPMDSPTGNGGIFFDENPNVELIDETISFSEIEYKFLNPKAKVVGKYGARYRT